MDMPGVGDQAQKHEGDPADLKDKILSLVISCPDACARAVNRLTRARSGAVKFALACDAIGFDFARQVFDGVSAEQWREFETLLDRNLFQAAQMPMAEVLLEVYMHLLGTSMEWQGEREGSNPFAFLEEVSEKELAAQLLADEDLTRISVICFYRGPSRISGVLSALTPQKRREVIRQVARLEKLPAPLVNQVATQFAPALRNALQRVIPPPPPPRTLSAPSAPPVPPAPRIEVEVKDPVVEQALERIARTVEVSVDRNVMQFIQKNSAHNSAAVSPQPDESAYLSTLSELENVLQSLQSKRKSAQSLK